MLPIGRAGTRTECAIHTVGLGVGSMLRMRRGASISVGSMLRMRRGEEFGELFEFVSSESIAADRKTVRIVLYVFQTFDVMHLIPDY